MKRKDNCLILSISVMREGLLMEMQPDSLTCGPLATCLPLGGNKSGYCVGGRVILEDG